jgi:hypothetical protein
MLSKGAGKKQQAPSSLSWTSHSWLLNVIIISTQNPDSPQGSKTAQARTRGAGLIGRGLEGAQQEELLLEAQQPRHCR